MNFRQVAKKLKANGWYEVKGGKGSHRKFKHAISTYTAFVPYHASADIPIGTLKTTEKGTGVKLL